MPHVQISLRLRTIGANMLIYDNETTNLLKPEVADLTAQPHIIELALVKLDAKYKTIGTYATLLKPPIPLNEEEHAKITGLTNADLADAPIFIEQYPALVDFCLGERTIIAHNLTFDLGILVAELRRIGKEYAFPYPPNGICTVEATKHLLGKRLKLTELYEIKLKKKLKQSHRAMSDVLALVEIVKVMKLC